MSQFGVHQAMDTLVIHNHAAAHACADGCIQTRTPSFGSAQLMLCQRGGVHIRVRHSGNPKAWTIPEPAGRKKKHPVEGRK